VCVFVRPEFQHHHPASPVAMANFVVDPKPFIPPAMVLEDGGPLRRAHREVYTRGGVAKTHEDCAIAVVNCDFPTTTRH
jgi:hypothetical protein